MNIEIYILCRNEVVMLPYVVRHYSQYGKIIILENNSTDNTVKLAKKLGCEVWTYYIPDEKSDSVMQKIKNECWKESKADWIMMVDADEFIYHPYLLDILSMTEHTVFEPEFINMFSEKFPTTKGQIYDEVKYGAPGDMWKAKMNLFSPKHIRNMNWRIGGHFAEPEGNVKICYDSGIKTLHMKFLSRGHVIKNFKQQAARKNKEELEMGLNGHYLWTKKEINKYFDEHKPLLTKQVL